MHPQITRCDKAMESIADPSHSSSPRIYLIIMSIALSFRSDTRIPRVYVAKEHTQAPTHAQGHRSGYGGTVATGLCVAPPFLPSN